jgi:hypothetical protein
MRADRRSTNVLRFKFLVLIVIVAVSASACGGETSETNGDDPFGAIGDIADGSSGEDGNSADSSVQLSENVTIPLPDGGTVTASQTDTGYGYAYVEYSADRYDEIVDFYNEWIVTDSRDWSGFDSSFESQGTVNRGWLWDSSGTRFGVKDCIAGGSGGTFNAVCVEISEWEE